MEKSIRKILVVCRTPEPFRAALDHGAVLAKTFGAELVLLLIMYDPFLRGDWNLPIPLGTLEEEFRKTTDKAKEVLHDAAVSARSCGLTVRELFREGKPADEIYAAARAESADLIVMLAHGETRLEHLFFGRSNDDLIRKMPCSIFLVKSEPE